MERKDQRGERALSIMKKDKNIHLNGQLEWGEYENKRLEQYNFKCRENLRNVTKIDLLFPVHSTKFFFLPKRSPINGSEKWFH
jgi:hypothetical protein